MSDNRYIDTEEGKPLFGDGNQNQVKLPDLYSDLLPFNETPEEKQKRLEREQKERETLLLRFYGLLQSLKDGDLLTLDFEWDMFSKQIKEDISGIIKDRELAEIEKQYDVWHSWEYGGEDESPFDKRD